MKTENLKNWLLAPERRELISINKLEQQMEVAKGTVEQWLSGRRSLPEKHVQPLIDTLKLLEYKPD